MYSPDINLTSAFGERSIPPQYVPGFRVTAPLIVADDVRLP
jgi:hypothetical protein